MNEHQEFLSKYPKDEIELLQKNNLVIEEMKRLFASLASNEYENELVKVINSDGFYPYYTHQKVKVLFIGKESLGLDGKNYIEALIYGIQKNDPRGHKDWNEKHPNDKWAKVMTNNSDPFHSKMLYIAYGLNNGNCSYKDMPWASDIGKNLFSKAEGINYLQGEPGVSYAFMNYSKFDNPSENAYCADRYRMQTFSDMVKRSGVNWFEKQISLLDPDIIIDMNINREYVNNLGSKSVEWVQYGENLSVGYLSIAEKKYLLFETWHFSCPGMGFEKKYYLPIIETWTKFGNRN